MPRSVAVSGDVPSIRSRLAGVAPESFDLPFLIIISLFETGVQSRDWCSDWSVYQKKEMVGRSVSRDRSTYIRFGKMIIIHGRSLRPVHGEVWKSCSG